MVRDIPETLRTPSQRGADRPTSGFRNGSIEASVGAGGVNDPDDMREVKKLLNAIPAEQGGAFNSLDVGDVSTSNAEFGRFVEAIRIFQKHHLSKFFQADGLVEPRKRTINKLVEEVRKAAPKPPADKTALSIRPAEILKGFSDEGLKKSGKEWGLDLGGNPCQMVPENGSRKLLLLAGSNKVSISTQIEDPEIASISSSDDQSITISAKPIRDPQKTETLLNIFANGQLSRTVRVIVRRRLTITVHFHFLGDQAKRKGVFFEGTGASQAMITGLNRIYEPQTNIVFTKGQERTLATINGRDIDFDKPMVIDTTDLRTATPGQQLFQGKEFTSSCIGDGDKAVVNVFLVANVSFFNDAGKIGPNIIGSANDIGGRRCWFSATRFAEAGNRFVLISHEIGHALGLTHIGFMPKALMHPTIGANNVFIPSETLEELPR